MTTPLPSQTPVLPQDALSVLSVLNEHRVEHVLIGEIAAAVYGRVPTASTVTIVPARFGRNLERLARGLRALHAHPTAPAGASPADIGTVALRRLGSWSLDTDRGELELDFEPPATAGHLDLFDGARRYELAPKLGVEVAALADLIRIAEMRRSGSDEDLLHALRVAGRSAVPAITPG